MSQSMEFTHEDIKSIEAKHITYVVHQDGKDEDLHLVKEVVHLKDGRKIPRVKPWLNYTRPFYITQKGQRNHEEKKDYEYVRNLQKYTTTQLRMPGEISKLLREYSKKYDFGPYPRLKAFARCPFLYGTDVSSSACLKYQYRQDFPGTITRNTVAGADIETNVIEDGKDGQIICMSVTFKERALLCYYEGWVKDVPNVIEETKRMAREVPEMIEFMRSRNIADLDVRVCKTPAQVVIECIDALHAWKPDFMSFWNMDFDISRILRNLNDYGVSPAKVFSDKTVPRQYQYFDYNQANAKTTTASGVTKSKAMEELWNWVTAPASFQCIDAMSIYRALRIAKGKEPSYALDRILKKELNWKLEREFKDEAEIQKFLDKLEEQMKLKGGGSYTLTHNGEEERTYKPRQANAFRPGDKVHVEMDFGKLKYKPADHLTGIDWHKYMQGHSAETKIYYGLYNVIDSGRLEQLDEKVDDLSSSITMFSKYSDYKNFNSTPKRLCDDMHFWYLNRPEPSVIGSSSDKMVMEIDTYVVGHHDWMSF